MRAPADIISLQEARALLGLSSEAGREAIAVAFRTAAKRLHPDRPGGELARFRRIVEAYRRLLAHADEGQSAARERLRRFAEAWTAQPL
jgi:curved DNA-binding protein CbpA